MLAALLACAAIALGNGAWPALGTTCGALRCSTFTVGLGGNGTGVLAVVTSTGTLTGTIECHRGGGLTTGVCAFSYPTDAVIYYKVGASPGSKTTCKVVGCDTSTSIKHFTLSSNMTLSAYGFALLDPVTISVSVTGSGSGDVTSKPAGISCGDGKTACAVAFAAGSSVTLTAAQAGGSTFHAWSGDCSGTQATCALSPTSGTSVSAGARFDLAVTSTPTPKPTPTRAPTPRPTTQPTQQPSQPARTTAPGRTASPGATAAGATTAPSSGPVAEPSTSAEPMPEESSAAGETTSGPSLAPIDTPSTGGQPASSSGSGVPILVPVLVVLLVLLAGGAFAFRKPGARS